MSSGRFVWDRADVEVDGGAVPAVARAGGAAAHPGDTGRLHQYWVHGEGAAKIRWGQGGDYDRCVLHLGKYLADPHGYCAKAHHEALGIWPATHAAMEKKTAGRSAVTTMQRAGTKKPYGDVPYADPGYLDADGNPASKSGKPGIKRYPLSPDKVQAAWSYINQAKNAAQYTAEQLSAIKGRIRSAMAKHGHDVSDDDSGSQRWAPLPFNRDFPLQDISIRAGGDGRTVDAYATVFDTPTPIHDQQGDYIEVIDRHAFDRILPKLQPQGDRKAWRCGVFYNHGMTLHGTPSGENSLPIGVPLEIRADGHGLFTRTRYHKGPEIDRILEAIREGSLQAYSFSGRFDQSEPIVPRGGFRPDRNGSLPTVRRRESTLREYGPTPFPAYPEAEITAVRAEQLLRQLEQMAELLRSGAPLDSPQFSGAPADRDSPTDDLLGPEVDLPVIEGEEHSARYHQHELYLLESKARREAVGLVW